MRERKYYGKLGDVIDRRNSLSRSSVIRLSFAGEVPASRRRMLAADRFKKCSRSGATMASPRSISSTTRSAKSKMTGWMRWGRHHI